MIFPPLLCVIVYFNLLPTELSENSALWVRIPPEVTHFLKLSLSVLIDIHNDHGIHVYTFGKQCSSSKTCIKVGRNIEMTD